MVGCFDYRDTEAFYVLNYDADSAATATQTITLTLDDDYYVRIMQQGKEEVYQTTSDKKVVLRIESGKAALVVIQGEDDMICSMSDGFTLADVDADGDATIVNAITDTTSVATITAENTFATWGTYKVTYLVDGKQFSRKLDMYLPGDITHDGTNSAKDLVRMKKKASGQTVELSKIQTLSADLNGDSNIDDADVAKLRYILIGKR